MGGLFGDKFTFFVCVFILGLQCILARYALWNEEMPRNVVGIVVVGIFYIAAIRMMWKGIQ